MMKLSIYLFGLLVSGLAFSGGASDSKPKKVVPKFSGSIDYTASGFAYYKRYANHRIEVYISQITDRSEPVLASKPKLVEAFPINSKFGSEDFRDFSVSTDNRFLKIYSLESVGEFHDLNMKFYDLYSGDYVGQLNEHSFAGLNESLHPSHVLDQYVSNLEKMGADPEYIKQFDYQIDADIDPEFESFQWNSDGTISVSYWLETEIVLNGAIQASGPDLYTINFSVNDKGVLIESYTSEGNTPYDGKTLNHDLSLADEQNGDYYLPFFVHRQIFFNGCAVHFSLFDDDLSGAPLYMTGAATRILGNIQRWF